MVPTVSEQSIEEKIEKKNKIRIAICIIGIIMANIELIFFLITDFDVYSLLCIIPILFFDTVLILITLNKLKVITIVLNIAIILVFVIPVGLFVAYELFHIGYHPSIARIDTQTAKVHNKKFENYFGSDVTMTVAKELLSEIKINNLTSQRNDEQAIVGVCFISKYAKQDYAHAIYNLDINPKDFNKKVSYELMFTANVETITDLLEKGTSYVINVPNTKAFDIIEQKDKTGFESDNGGFDSLVTGESGGYYSSGFIRLIYIIDNRNRYSSTTNNDVTTNNYNQTYKQYPNANIIIDQNISRNTDY